MQKLTLEYKGGGNFKDLKTSPKGIWIGKKFIFWANNKVIACTNLQLNVIPNYGSYYFPFI